MSTPPEVSPPRQRTRVGILLNDVRKLNASALKFLVLKMNTLQQPFEYEFFQLSYNENDVFQDELLQKLSYQASVERNDEVRPRIRAFRASYLAFLQRSMAGVQEKALPPYLILVTMARFTDNFYSMSEDDVAILALGNWQRYMAPPSIVEFMLTLIVRRSVGFICPTFDGSIHLSTRSCLFDFSPSLDEVRLKVLNGFICSSCRAMLQSEGLSTLAEELTSVLGKGWLGKSADPDTPAGIAAHLGYDLFTTKGLQPTPWETFKTTLQEEWVKQLLILIVTILAAILLALLGLKSS